MEELPGLDIRSEALVIGRWFLAELDAERYLNRILEQDGDRLPAIRDVIRERIIDAGHRRVERLVRHRLHAVRPDLNAEALAALVIGPLANHRRVEWTYGQPPLSIDDSRLLSTWAEVLAILLEAQPVTSTKSSTTRTTAGTRRRGSTSRES